MEKKISVIVPIYNAEKTLKKCVVSLCRQTYKNIEILLVDDGSLDNSLKLAYQLAAKDDRIIVIEKKINEGVMKARKTGVEKASGEYIGFVDSDDWVEPEMYQSLYQAIEKHNADVAFCGCQEDYPDGTVKYVVQAGSGQIFSPEEAIEKMNNHEIFLGALWRKLIDKKLFDLNDFDADVTIGEDYRISSRIFFRAHKVVCGGGGYYHYVQHIGSACHRGYSGDGANILNNFTEIKNEIIDKYPNIADAAIRHWAIQEMAVVTSMVKAGKYDTEIMRRVKNDIRLSLKTILHIKKLNLYYKICAILLSLNEQLLIIPYKVVWILHFQRKLKVRN